MNLNTIKKTLLSLVHKESSNKGHKENLTHNVIAPKTGDSFSIDCSNNHPEESSFVRCHKTLDSTTDKHLKINRFGSIDIDDYVEYITTNNNTEAYFDFSLFSKILVNQLQHTPEYTNIKETNLEYTMMFANEASYLDIGDCAFQIYIISNANGFKQLPSSFIHTKVEGYLHYEMQKMGKVNSIGRIKIFSVKPTPMTMNGFVWNNLTSEPYDVKLRLDALTPGLYKAIDDLYPMPKYPIVLNWLSKNGDLVNKGDIICKIETPFGMYEVRSKDKGYLCVSHFSTTQRQEVSEIEFSEFPSYDFYSIYHDINNLLADHYQSEIKFDKDEFTGLAKTSWIKLAGVSDPELNGDSFFVMESYNNENLFIFPQYKDDKVLLVVGANSNNLKLAIGDQLMLLLQDPIVPSTTDNAVFTLSKEYLMSSHKYFDTAFSTDLAPENLFRLTTLNCIKWRLYPKGGNRTIIEGNNESFWASKDISGNVFRQVCFNFWTCLDEKGINHISFPSSPVTNNSDVSNLDDDFCYVYLMVDTANGYYKIGMSKNPEYREGTLQSEKPSIELVCAKKYPTRQIAASIESALHKTYSSKNLRGEWFLLTDVDIEQLKATLS